jgi:hypothetical protein
VILRLLGALVAGCGAVVTAVLEAFLTPLRWGAVRLPASVVLAVLTNLLLLWFTHKVTGHRMVALLPGLLWLAVMIVASGRTTEGDLVLTANNWVVFATILGGVAAYVAGAYRLLIAPPGRGPTPGSGL